MKFKTERLIIRPASIDDQESMYRYRSNPDTNKYLSLIPKTVEDVAAFIDKTSKDINVPGTWFQFVLIEQASNLLIGDIGIHFLLSDQENKTVEIGYTLDTNCRGKGYASEGWKIIIGYLINNLNKHRIIASIDPLNVDSLKLVERLAFRKEAHFVKSLFFHGKWVDDLVYATLAEEWKREN